MTALVVAVGVICASPAEAGGRKRLVVLDFEGPKAEKFHDDIVRLIKKANTVVSAEKWNSVAEEMDAGKVTEKNVKRIAKKLKIDGVITGKIEKRRDEYIVQIKLRAGSTGELVGNRVDTKADGPRLDGKAARDIKEELLPAIDELEANHGGGGDDDEQDTKPTKKKKVADDADDEDKPAKKSKKSDDDEDKPAKKSKKSEDDEDKPAKKAKGGARLTSDDDEDAEPKKSGFGKRDDDARGGDRVGKKSKDDEEDKPAKKAKKDDEPAKKAKKDDEDKPAKKAKKDDDESSALSTKHDEDDTPLPKAKKRPKSADEDTDEDHPKKKVAKSDEEEDTSTEAEADASVDAAAALSPSQRAVDAVVGLSFVARSLSFKYDTDLATPPPGYKQSVPVAGALLDATVYPLSMGHKRHDILAGLGFSLMFDKVLKITSQKKFTQMDGTTAVANIATSESKFGLGAVFRYPLGKGADAPVVLANLGYTSQSFEIGQTLPNGDPVDIPNVAYSLINIGGGVRYPVNAQIILNADVGLILVAGTGDISTPNQFGKASVLGLQGAGGLDYMLTKNIFVRGMIRVERIGYTFAGGAKQTNMRDGDPEQDVQGATDLYYGGTATVGYLY